MTFFEQFYPKGTHINLNNTQSPSFYNNLKMLMVDKYSKDNLLIIGNSGYAVYHENNQDFSIKKFVQQVMQRSIRTTYVFKYLHHFIICHARTCNGSGLVDWCATGAVDCTEPTESPDSYFRKINSCKKKEDRDYITVFFIPQIDHDKRVCSLCSGTGLHFPEAKVTTPSVVNKIDKLRRKYHAQLCSY
jgi:hypothetical protein